MAATVVVLSSCLETFEYSPNQVFNSETPTGLNATNIARLDTLPKDDTITVAFVGDSQRFYDELDTFIDTVNAIPSVDFILLAGDITDFGLLSEFELIEERLSRLNKPYIGVIGNHDAQAKGDQVFKRMFGPLDFSFTYQQVKFVCHNTNSKEFEDGNVPDMQWLSAQLVRSDSAKYFIPVSHVPPFSADVFNQNLEASYTDLFARTPGLLVSLHGHVHEHQDGYPYDDGVRYMTSYSFDQESFVLLKIYSGQVEKILVDY